MSKNLQLLLQPERRRAKMLDWIRFILTSLFLFAALTIFISQFVGIHRFKYVLNRMHAAAMGDTLGLLFGIAGVVLGVWGLRNPDVSAVTLSTLIGSAILMIGVGYLVALFGINRFEKQVKEFGKAITGAE